MCVILPVDHIACTHTVALWQHCIDAPRSKAYGLEPCSKIRQHARPLLTRKLCINCGGPRFFARRGGLAEQGRGSAGLQILTREKEEDSSDANDSGYHSDVIHEEDEEDDGFALSPKASWVGTKNWRRRQDNEKEPDAGSPERTPRHQRGDSRGRRPSWKPNLKSEFSSHGSPSCNTFTVIEPQRYVPSNLDSTTMGSRPKLPAIDTNPIQHPRTPWQKKSTLLHPSPPPSEPSTPPRSESPTPTQIHRPAFAFPLSSQLKEQHPMPRPQPHRKSSTLLRPSSPKNKVDDTTPCSLPPPSASAPPTMTNITARPPPPRRKGSTLLHPSSPPFSPPLTPRTSTDTLRPTPQPAKLTYVVLPPTPPSSNHTSPPLLSKTLPPPLPVFTFPPSLVSSSSFLSTSSSSSSSSRSSTESRRPSVLHSSLSDNESDNDDEDVRVEIGEFKPMEMAQRVRVGRASRIFVNGSPVRAA